MNTHSNANPNTTGPNASRASLTEPWIRNPTRKPIAVVIASDHTSTAVSATARPVSTALRGIGNERIRSTTPASRSSAIAVAAPMPANSTLVVTNPGTRKST